MLKMEYRWPAKLTPKLGAFLFAVLSWFVFPTRP